jgi:hypothetical protein
MESNSRNDSAECVKCPLTTQAGIVNLTRVWQTGGMKKPTPGNQRHRFLSEIIRHAVWLYHRYLEVDGFAGLRLKM